MCPKSVSWRSRVVFYWRGYGTYPHGQVINSFNENPVGTYQIVRDKSVIDLEFTQGEYDEGFQLGLEFHDFVSFPRVKIHELDKTSNAYKAGLRSDDYIISVNDTEIFTITEFEEILATNTYFDFYVYRNGFVEEFIYEDDDVKKVIISDVIPGDPADIAGIKDGDVVISIKIEKLISVPNLIRAYLVKKIAE